MSIIHKITFFISRSRPIVLAFLLLDIHVSFHLSSAQTSSVQRYAKVYNSLTTQFIKLLQITLETKLHANDYTRLINNENAALEYINYSDISIFYSQFKSFTSSTCIFFGWPKSINVVLQASYL